MEYAIQLIRLLPEDQIPEVLEELLKNKLNEEQAEWLADYIQRSDPKKFHQSFFFRLLDQDNPILNATIRVSSSLTKEGKQQVVEIVKRKLHRLIESNSSNNLILGLRTINQMPNSEQFSDEVNQLISALKERIESNLSLGKKENLVKTFLMISYLPERLEKEYLTKLIIRVKVLIKSLEEEKSNENNKERRRSINTDICDLVYLLPGNERYDIVRNLLRQKNPETTEIVIDKIDMLNSRERIEILTEFLNSPSLRAQDLIIIAKAINSLPDDLKDKIRNLFFVRVSKFIEGEVGEIGSILVHLIKVIPNEKVARYLKNLHLRFKKDLEDSLEIVIDQLKYKISPGLSDVFMEFIKELPISMQNVLISPPLYDANIDFTKTIRSPFNKTGSETTLLGGSLQYKAIIRHLVPEAFISWQNLYEDEKL